MAISTPSPCIVDTNVALVANKSSTAGPNCVIACSQALREIVKSGHVVIDNAWRIIGEYKHKLSPSGQPGPGDAFLKWMLTNMWNPRLCTQVAITELDADPEDFKEFPDSLRTVRFDRSDRKFVAVAVVHGASPHILQGFDSKWWGWRENLKAEGIKVFFLCEEEIAAKYEEKMG